MYVCVNDRSDIEWIVLSDHPVNLDNCMGPDTEDIDVITNYDKKRNLKGYGALCESELVAILTAVGPQKNELSAEYEGNIYDDADVKYTEIFPYLWWIFEILQKEELEDIANNNFNPSLPYRERKTANIVRNATSNESKEILNSETEIDIVLNDTTSGILEIKNADMVLNDTSSELSSKQERDTSDLGLYNTSSELLKSTAIRINMSDLYLLIWISFLQFLSL
ncbi:uncharacterized protein [Drosophila tropicalis]|uniref:uncharacterized protein n=1 Tax=Drosophila tropicalis TaxID=46794 RepID=UPI0035AC0015